MEENGEKWKNNTPSCALGKNDVEEMELLAILNIQPMWKKLVFPLALAD